MYVLRWVLTFGLTHRSIESNKATPNSNRNAYTVLSVMFIIHLTAIRLHLTAISLFHFHIFQVKSKLFFQRLANTSKINKKYIKRRTILFLLPSISFYQEIKGISKKKVRIFENI
jgi:hypothetical protein